MANFKKLIAEVSKMCYERVDNDAKAYRYQPEAESKEVLKKKVKYLSKHLRDIQQHEKTEREQVTVYGTLGTAYFKLGDFEKAREHYDIQLDMGEELRDLEQQRMAHANIGVLLKLQWKLSEALGRFNQSLDICIKANNKWGMGRLYNNIANIYEMTMDFERAVEFQKLRLDISTELDDRDGYVKSCVCIAAMYHVLGDNHDAIRFYEQAMDQLRKNLQILEDLADDESGSDDEGYINLGGDDDGEGGGGNDGGDGSKKKGKFSKFKRKKKK